MNAINQFSLKRTVNKSAFVVIVLIGVAGFCLATPVYAYIGLAVVAGVPLGVVGCVSCLANKWWASFATFLVVVLLMDLGKTWFLASVPRTESLPWSMQFLATGSLTAIIIVYAKERFGRKNEIG